jgi:hypothetical protein
MTIIKSNKMKLRGLSSDTKPSSGDIDFMPVEGQRFIETDTGLEYEFDGTDWQLITTTQFLTAFLSSVNTAGVYYLGFGDLSANALEAKAQWMIPQNIHVTELQAIIKTNDHTANITIKIRDDGVDVPNTTITVGSTALGLFTTGQIKELIDGGSLISILVDTTGAGVQLLQGYFIMSYANGRQV